MNNNSEDETDKVTPKVVFGLSEKPGNSSELCSNQDPKEILYEYTQESSLHGIKYTTRSDFFICRRVIWIAGWATMFTVLIYFITPRIQTYLRKPIDTKVIIKVNSSLAFPAVTICNFNRFKSSAFTNDEIGRKTRDAMADIYGIDQDVNINWTDPFFSTSLESGLDTMSWIRNASHQLDTMFMSCLWKSTEINCSEYLTSTLTEMGFCYTFNSEEYIRKNGSALRVRKTGSDHGLWLKLNVEQFEYTYGESNAAGFKILVHNVKEVPLTKELGIAVSPGTDSYISVRRLELDRLPPPYEGSTCVETNTPSFTNHLAYYSTYSMSACRLECMANYTIGKCNCKNYYMPGKAPLCSFYQLKFCLLKAIEEFSSKEISCNCFEECKMTVFETLPSSAYYPAAHILRVLESKGLNESDIRKNMLELRIYYEELNFDSIEQVAAYEFGNLFSDIGGQLGLCIGASVLSVYECIEAFTVALLSCCRKQKQKSESSHSAPKNNAVSVK